MKTQNKVLLALAAVAMSTSALAGITDTKHNLSSTASAATRTNFVSGSGAAGTGEICVFCHTPHAADASGTDNPPLWNKSLPNFSGINLYDNGNSSSIDGDVLAIGSVSAACLSCHDGSQAMDVMINAPGSGLQVSGTPSRPNGGAGYTWTGSDTMTGLAAIAADTADLTNDHPIGIQYAGGGYSSSSPTTQVTTGNYDADFNAPSHTTINGADVWWVNTTVTGSTNGREKTDIQLYTRDNGGTDEPFVECASCHDPHTSDQPTFLRISNSGSAVCLACHDK